MCTGSRTFRTSFTDTNNFPAMLAMARFPEVPAIWMSHDFKYWYDTPPTLSRIHRYLPVDLTRWRYLANDCNIPP